MAELVAIVGPPGRGKSTSLFPNEELKIKGLNPAKTILLNVSGKSPAVKGWKKLFNEKPLQEGGTYKVLDSQSILHIDKILSYIDASRPEIENIVIEDAQYFMGFAVMDKAKEKGLTHKSSPFQIHQIAGNS